MKYYKDILKGRGSKLPEFSSLDFHLKLAGEGILYRKPENRKKEPSFAECLVKFANDRSSFRDFYLDGLMEKIAVRAAIAKLAPAAQKARSALAKNLVAIRNKAGRGRQAAKKVLTDVRQKSPGIFPASPRPGFLGNIGDYWNSGKNYVTNFLNTKATPFIDRLSQGFSNASDVPGAQKWQLGSFGNKLYKGLDVLSQIGGPGSFTGAVGNLGKNIIGATGWGLGQKPVNWLAPTIGLGALALGNTAFSSFKDQRPYMTPPMYG